MKQTAKYGRFFWKNRIITGIHPYPDSNVEVITMKIPIELYAPYVPNNQDFHQKIREAIFMKLQQHGWQPESIKDLCFGYYSEEDLSYEIVFSQKQSVVANTVKNDKL